MNVYGLIILGFLIKIKGAGRLPKDTFDCAGSENLRARRGVVGSEDLARAVRRVVKHGPPAHLVVAAELGGAVDADKVEACVSNV